MKTYALAEDGEICFSAEDLARMPADFEKKIKAAAKEKGGSLVLKKEPKAIADGFCPCLWRRGGELYAESAV